MGGKDGARGTWGSVVLGGRVGAVPVTAPVAALSCDGGRVGGTRLSVEQEL